MTCHAVNRVHESDAQKLESELHSFESKKCNLSRRAGKSSGRAGDVHLVAMSRISLGFTIGAVQFEGQLCASKPVIRAAYLPYQKQPSKLQDDGARLHRFGQMTPTAPEGDNRSAGRRDVADCWDAYRQNLLTDRTVDC